MQISTHSVTIDADSADVFGYVREITNMPEWAVNFTHGLRREGGRWIVTTPMGDSPVAVREDADSGVVDFLYGDDRADVAYARVLPIGERTEFVFTFAIPPEVPREEFERGQRGMDEELAVLKRVLEA